MATTSEYLVIWYYLSSKGSKGRPAGVRALNGGDRWSVDWEIVVGSEYCVMRYYLSSNCGKRVACWRERL